MRYDIFGRLDYGVNAYDSWQLYSANENAEYNLKAQNSFIDDTDVDYEDQIYDVLHSFDYLSFRNLVHTISHI